MLSKTPELLPKAYLNHKTTYMHIEHCLQALGNLQEWWELHLFENGGGARLCPVVCRIFASFFDPTFSIGQNFEYPRTAFFKTHLLS